MTSQRLSPTGVRMFKNNIIDRNKKLHNVMLVRCIMTEISYNYPWRASPMNYRTYTKVCDLFSSNFEETIIQTGRIKNNECVRRHE